jgi:hypothetical protein
MILIFNSEKEWSEWLDANECPEKAVCVVDYSKEKEKIVLFIDETYSDTLDFLTEKFFI